MMIKKIVTTVNERMDPYVRHIHEFNMQDKNTLQSFIYAQPQIEPVTQELVERCRRTSSRGKLIHNNNLLHNCRNSGEQSTEEIAASADFASNRPDDRLSVTVSSLAMRAVISLAQAIFS